MGEEKKPLEKEKARADAEKPKAEDQEKPKPEEGKKENIGGGDGGEGDKKKEGGEGEATATPPPPPPPPEEVVMKVYMHCEGCARNVRRSLKGFEGVEDVMTDCKVGKVVVKGKKAAEDPLKVVERVQRKTGRKVELISPQPPAPRPDKTDEEKKKEDEPEPKAEEKKEEPPVIAVVLKVHMHCEACAQEIKKRILKMKGVEAAEPDLKASEVTVKGVFHPPKLIEYVYKRTGKQAVIVKVEPEDKKPSEHRNKPTDDEGKKPSDGDSKEETKSEDKKSEGNNAADGADATEGKVKITVDGGDLLVPEEAVMVPGGKLVELKRNEFYYYYPRYHHPVEYHHHHHAYPYPPNPYPPQLFSDENPNACSVM